MYQIIGEKKETIFDKNNFISISKWKIYTKHIRKVYWLLDFIAEKH